MNLISISIVAVSLVLLLVLGGIGGFLQHRTIVGREKSSAYECGLDPNKSARIPFSLRLFLLAVIFLVLDVEIALLMGVPISLRSSFKRTVVSGTLFLLVLVVGLLHE